MVYGKERSGDLVYVNRDTKVELFSIPAILVPHGNNTLQKGDNEFPFSAEFPSDEMTSFHKKIKSNRDQYGMSDKNIQLKYLYCIYSTFSNYLNLH